MHAFVQREKQTIRNSKCMKKCQNKEPSLKNYWMENKNGTLTLEHVCLEPGFSDKTSHWTRTFKGWRPCRVLHICNKGTQLAILIVLDTNSRVIPVTFTRKIFTLSPVYHLRARHRDNQLINSCFYNRLPRLLLHFCSRARSINLCKVFTAEKAGPALDIWYRPNRPNITPEHRFLFIIHSFCE